VAGLELLTIKIQQMTIEGTNDNNSTNTAITYSECYQQLIYPRLPASEDRRRVLTSEQIDEIISLYDSGMTSRKIASMFGVSKTTILYHCKSGLDKEKLNRKRYELLCLQEKRDPAFKAKRHEEKMQWQKDILKRSEPKRKYKGKATYKWKKKKYHTDPEFRAKTRKQAIDSYFRKQKLSTNNATEQV
jgi:DNA-binding CsgD family transcriptional regulator